MDADWLILDNDGTHSTLRRERTWSDALRNMTDEGMLKRASTCRAHKFLTKRGIVIKSRNFGGRPRV
jgi:hypothetical protein